MHVCLSNKSVIGHYFYLEASMMKFVPLLFVNRYSAATLKTFL